MMNPTPNVPQKRRPAYERVPHPPGMQLTERDRHLLLTIYQYDGLLSVDQVQRWFFPGTHNRRNAQRRISLLYQHGFLQRPRREDLYRLPTAILWLDKRGAEVVAAQLDVELSDLPWRASPKWSRVAHDLALNEFRHSLVTAAVAHPTHHLETWHGQEALARLFNTPIPYQDRQGARRQKLVHPDGYCGWYVTPAAGPAYRLHFLIELDNGTESHSRFGRDKVAPGAHLLHSPLYQMHTGAQSGRFLVVVVGPEARFQHMRAEVTAQGGAPYFLFTRYAAVTPDTVLTAPLWHFAHQDTPFSLVDYATPAFQTAVQASFQNVPRLTLRPAP